MNDSTLGRATVPWYREPWPWILMGGPAIVVVAAFATLYLAVRHADPLVVDNYYKEGLAINRVLARDHLAFERGYRALVMLNQDRTLLRIQLTGPRPPDQLRVRFTHPTKAGLDQLVIAQQIQPGLYEGTVRLAASLRWDIEVEDAREQWRLTGDWYASDDRFVLEAKPK